MTNERWYVEFDSPGTLFHETSRRPINKPSIAGAVKLAGEVVERHGAKPFGFRFVKMLEHDDVPDGRGGTLQVHPRELERSGRYHLGGRLRTLDDVERDDKPDETILRSNMAANGWFVVVENTNSYRTTNPFEEDDILLDEAGHVRKQGNDPGLVSYRETRAAMRRAELAAYEK